MAQPKMRCSFQRTHRDNQKVLEAGETYTSRNFSQLDNLKTFSEDSEISSFDLRNANQRCAILTFLTLESDGQWRIVALPLQYFDHTHHLGSGVQVNMDGLHLLSTPSINSFKVDGRKTQKGPPTDVSYSAKPFAARSFPGSNVRHQFRNRNAANKATKLNEFSGNSSPQTFITCNDSSAFILKGSSAKHSSEVFIDSPKEDKVVKKSFRKKVRKKGKQRRKHSCDIGSTEPVICSEYAHASSTFETSGNGDGEVSCVTSPEVSSSDGSVNMIDFEVSNTCTNSSESPNTCISEIDEVDISEDVVPSTIHNFPEEHHVIDSVIGIQTKDPSFSSMLGGFEGMHSLEVGPHNGIHHGGFSHMQNSLLPDSVSDGSNSDVSTSARHNVRPFDESIHEVGRPEPPKPNSRKRFSHQDSPRSAVESNDCTEGMRHGGQSFSSRDVHAVIPSKEGKQYKTVPKSSNNYKLGSVGNSQRRTGKENNHSVWQRVQRNSMDGCNNDVSLKEAPLLKRNASDVTTLSRSDDKKQLKDKVPRKSKRKVSSASKQQNSSYSRKGCHPNKVNSNSHAKSSMQRNEILNMSTPLNEQKGMKNVSRTTGCSRVNAQTSREEYTNSESVHSSLVCPDNLEPVGSICDSFSGAKDQSIQNQDISRSRLSDSLDQQNKLQAQPLPYLPHVLFNNAARTEKELSLVDNNKQNHGSGSTLLKWIPVGMKDPGLTSSVRSASSLLEPSNGPHAEDWTLRNITQQKRSSRSQDLISPLNGGVVCKPKGSANVNGFSHENGKHIQMSRKLNACTVNENNSKNGGANCLGSESRDKNCLALETDLNKISRAVKDACNAQLASEALQVAIGGPIAEFERLLHFCCPVISHSHNSVNCKTCLQDQVPSALLCRHERPNIPLGCLWQWYEKHGSYGLEIRAEDYGNPKRFGVDQFAFRAYFVPFLSAVQLFRNSKSHSARKDDGIPPWASESCETDATPGNSLNIGHLPIFSVLVPQPRTSDTRADEPEPSSISPEDELSVQAEDMTVSNDPELIFEYFEYEQPQQRRPLYEKIQELVKGDVPPQCKMYGDPANLHSMNVDNLHPRSWYSVAWYPIYRIPDGSFRAAFLTYHSLGHLVRRSSKSDCSSLNSSIVSPVVGLQSYNAQGECWFQLRQSKLNQTAESLNPSGVLKERLRTLEGTASLMARAVVNKGDQTSVNRHPDYEFFLSRRC